MEHSFEPRLFDVDKEEEAGQQPPQAAPGRRKFRSTNRQQTVLASIYVEELIAADHKARAIWSLAGRMDLSRFAEPLCSTVGCAGRPAWDPHLLVSVWVYAYSEGIGSAREIERMMEWEPGLQWLGGLETINHHTLSDFRVNHQTALEGLFRDLLAILDQAGVVNLEQVMHDGTKIRAQAGSDSFRREKTLKERQEQARQVVAEMGDPSAPAPNQDRRRAARERVARQQAELLDAGVKELEALQAEKKTEEEKAEVRVSVSEPEARFMKHGDHAIVPSYNAQISTESKNKIIVGVHLSQCSSDAQSLMPALEKIAENVGRKPSQIVNDGGFTNRDNIHKCAEQNIDMVGSLPDPAERTAAAMKAAGIDPKFAPTQFRIIEEGRKLECPAGQQLERLRKNRKRGNLYQQYRAQGSDCMACPHQAQCCPKNPEKGRTVSIRLEEQADVAAFRKKMESEEYRAIYRKRGEVAEFPNAWIKEKLGLRKFRLRGLAKAGREMLWACLTYNIMQWERLVWRGTALA